MTRQPRALRRFGVRADLTDRDRSLLAALNRFRLASTSDLVSFAFCGTRRDGALRRLRRLFDAGYLDVRAGDRAKENVYALGLRGRALFPESPARLPRGDIEHHLAIVHAWVSLAVAIQRTPGLRLDLVRPEWSIRQHVGAVPTVLVPDALVQLRVGTEHDSVRLLRFALEVDRATEPLTVLARKFARYGATGAAPDGLFGWREFGIVVALHCAGRLRRTHVEKLIEKRWTGWSFVWTEASELEMLLASLVAAPPLTSSPHARGGERAPSDVLP